MKTAMNVCACVHYVACTCYLVPNRRWLCSVSGARRPHRLSVRDYLVSNAHFFSTRRSGSELYEISETRELRLKDGRPSWKVLQSYSQLHGFESCSNPQFFSTFFFRNCFSFEYNCKGIPCISLSQAPR